ncbi:molybdopterin-dependent oxidoreductase [Benzoatithermus flavus]|uniref:Molybdopterin-dependent oxidoreductase n=1 Tax=Benzoatithermus flavus TaxID=3108223 RepID=A0ABU8XXS8_9PROT
MIARRHLLAASAGAGLALASRPFRLLAGEAVPLADGLPAGVAEVARLEALPGKRPLIKLTYRPPNYETPFEYFDSTITPNDAFFVRYHLADIPEVDASAWRLKVGGEAAASPLELALDQLRREFEPVELVAVCQCSGNRRGLSQPHVQGIEWGLGAMGNARWKGARLKDVLARAGLRKDAVEVAFNGADGPPLDKTPDFAKSLPVWKAVQDEVLVAYEMNGEPLPRWNGFPARIVVPGWTATYWVKHVTTIEALRQPFSGYWVKSAYRVPRTLFPTVERFLSQENETTTPITEMVVNAIVTSPRQEARLAAGQPFEIRGLAWDGGYGITRVEVSTDGGRTWGAATLGEDLGRFSFRPWRFGFTPPEGRSTILARASNRVGQTQVEAALFNPAGYQHNVVPRVDITAA